MAGFTVTSAGLRTQETGGVRTGTPFTGALLGGSGDAQQLFAATSGQLVDVKVGKSAVPDTTTNPAFKVTRTVAMPTGSVTGAAPEQMAAIYGLAYGAAGGQHQPLGLLGVSVQTSSDAAAPDALGVQGLARQMSGTLGNAIGGYFNGRTEIGSAGLANGLQLNVENFVADDAGKLNGLSNTALVWIKPTGTTATGYKNIGAGIQFGGGTGNGGGGANASPQVNYGIVFNSTSPVISQSFLDAGASVNAILVTGTKSDATIRTAAGTGPVVINGATVANTAMLQVLGGAADADPLIYVGNTGQNLAYSLRLRNSSGNNVVGIAGSPTTLLSGAAAGDLVIAAKTASTFAHLGGTSSVVKVGNANTLAFFGATAVAQPSRVGQLTDSTGGVVSTTLAAGITDSVAKNAIASLAAKVNALEVALSGAGGGLGLTA